MAPKVVAACLSTWLSRVVEKACREALPSYGRNHEPRRLPWQHLAPYWSPGRWGAAWPVTLPAQSQAILTDLEQEVRARTTMLGAKLIAWRRDIHQHPELGEQERARRAWLQITSRNLGSKSGLAWAGPALSRC